jgi:hypothetical protein
MCLYSTLFCVRCIVHTITCTNVTISHINNKTFFRSRVYTLDYFVFVVLYTQSIVLLLQYHISTTKHSSDIVTLVQVIVCTMQRTQNNVPYKHGNGRMFGC